MQPQKIRFGVIPPHVGVDYHTLRAYYLEAEKLGYDSVWLGDHMFGDMPYLGRELLGLPKVARHAPMGEVWTTHTALAAQTSRIRFGTMVLCNNYRHPPLLAKMAATLDVITNGRLEFGIGAGWWEEEYRNYGYDFPKAAVRLKQLREAIQILKLMWTEEAPSFQGEYYHITKAVCEPKPIQKPHPPLTIGGHGERLALRAVAEHADVWNCAHLSPDRLRAKLEILERHCQAVGRDPNSIAKSWLGTLIMDKDSKVRELLQRHAALRGRTVDDIAGRVLAGTPLQCVEKIEQYVALGITNFIVDTVRPDDLDAPAAFAAEVVPHFRQE